MLIIEEKVAPIGPGDWWPFFLPSGRFVVTLTAMGKLGEICNILQNPSAL